jgi:hypothetical protein
VLGLWLGELNYAVTKVAKPGAARDQLSVGDARIPLLGSREDAPIL